MPSPFTVSNSATPEDMRERNLTPIPDRVYHDDIQEPAESPTAADQSAPGPPLLNNGTSSLETLQYGQSWELAFASFLNDPADFKASGPVTRESTDLLRS